MTPTETASIHWLMVGGILVMLGAGCFIRALYLVSPLRYGL